MSLKVIYSELPGLIVFRIGREVFTLSVTETAIRTPFRLTSSSRGNLSVNNIDRWIFTNTSGKYSFEILRNLAEAWEDGRNSGVTQDSLSKIGDDIFYIIKDRLFGDGLASKYAQVFDIECSTLEQIRDQLRLAIKSPPDRSRVSRYVRVCIKNGWLDLANAWESLIGRCSSAGVDPSPVLTEMTDSCILNNIHEYITGLYRSKRNKKLVNGIHS